MSMMVKNSKKVPVFCECFCLVPHLDHSGLKAGDYVESVLQGRGKSELRPPHYHYLTLHILFCYLCIFLW